MNWLLNIALYQLVWFLCVLGGNRYSVLALLPIALHFALSPRRRADAILAGATLLLGMVVDGLLQLSGILVFQASAYPIPLWLMMIWIALATLLNHSLSWLKQRLMLAALLGAVGGALAYGSGVQLGTAGLGEPRLLSLALLAGIWGLLFPLLMVLARFSETFSLRRETFR